MGLTPQQTFSAAFLKVVDPRGAAPYMGSILYGMIRKETPGLGTLAVTKDGQLLWDPAWVAQNTPETVAAGLMHEAMHVMLKIWERGTALGVVPDGSPDQSTKAALLNRAHDACINGELRKTKLFKMPDSWVYPETLGQPEGLVLEERYHRLLKDQQQKQQSGSVSGEGEGEKGKPAVGEGWCGSCAQRPVPGEPPQSKEGRSEAEMDRFRRETAEAIKSAAAKDPGSVPDSLQRWAGELLAPPKIDWRTKLTRVVRSAVAYSTGKVDFTWTRPSRRQAGIGYGIGRAVVPAYHAPVPRIGIVVDTSGSMSPDDLALAMSETRGVLDACGADVSMLAVDCTAQGEPTEILTVEDAIKLLSGGGGTDMTPGFNAYAARRERPHVLIVFTDGHIGGGYPDVQPAWCTVVWVVVGESGNVRCCPWGEIVHVDESGAREAA